MNQKEHELNQLVERGVITPTEREMILGKQIRDQKVDHDKQKHGLLSEGGGEMMQKIITAGALFVGIGIVLLVATNWEYIGPLYKNLLAITVVTFCYAVGVYLRDVKNLWRTGEAMILIGGVATGASIALVSQTYNVFTEGYGVVLLLWSLCVIFPVYILLSTPLSVANAILVGVTIQVNIFENIRGLGMHSSDVVSAVTLLFTLIVFSLGGLHYLDPKYLRIGKAYRLASLPAGTVALWTLTEYFGRTTGIFSYSQESLGNGILFTVWGLGIVSVLLILISFAVNVPKDEVRKKMHYLPLMLSVFVPVTTLFWGDNSMQVAIGAIYNLLFIGSMFSVIYFGVSYGYKNYVNFGMIVLGLYFFHKVVDLLWELEGALFFISTGILLIFIGYVYEKVRVGLLKNTVKPEFGNENTI